MRKWKGMNEKQLRRNEYKQKLEDVNERSRRCE